MSGRRERGRRHLQDFERTSRSSSRSPRSSTSTPSSRGEVPAGARLPRPRVGPRPCPGAHRPRPGHRRPAADGAHHPRARPTGRSLRRRPGRGRRLGRHLGAIARGGRVRDGARGRSWRARCRRRRVDAGLLRATMGSPCRGPSRPAARRAHPAPFDGAGLLDPQTGRGPSAPGEPAATCCRCTPRPTSRGSTGAGVVLDAPSGCRSTRPRRAGPAVAQRAMTGGTLEAARRARHPRASPPTSAGASIMPSPTAAAPLRVQRRRRRSPSARRRIRRADLVVDLDLHDGDGTRSLFAADPTALYFSMHTGRESPASTAGDARSATASTPAATARRSWPLDGGPGVGFRPGLVVDLAVRPGGRRRARQLAALRRRDSRARPRRPGGARGLPLVVLLAGGYGEGAWRYTARFLGTLLRRPRAFEPPTTQETVLAALPPRRDPGARQPAAGGRGLGAPSQEDLLACGRRIRHGPRRLLGYYSRAALELALGAHRPPRSPAGPGLRPGRSSTSISPTPPARPPASAAAERPASSSARSASRPTARPSRLHPAAAVEWLLLQNPRRSFSPTPAPARPAPPRPRPAARRHRPPADPGLRPPPSRRLDLRPLALSHRRPGAGPLRFMDPPREGRFRALRQALRRACRSPRPPTPSKAGGWWRRTARRSSGGRRRWCCRSARRCGSAWAAESTRTAPPRRRRATARPCAGARRARRSRQAALEAPGAERRGLGLERPAGGGERGGEAAVEAGGERRVGGGAEPAQRALQEAQGAVRLSNLAADLRGGEQDAGLQLPLVQPAVGRRGAPQQVEGLGRPALRPPQPRRQRADLRPLEAVAGAAV